MFATTIEKTILESVKPIPLNTIEEMIEYAPSDEIADMIEDSNKFDKHAAEMISEYRMCNAISKLFDGESYFSERSMIIMSELDAVLQGRIEEEN